MVIEKEKLYQQYHKNATKINANEVKKLDRHMGVPGKIVSIVAIIILIFAIWQFTARGESLFLLGGMMFAFLSVKLFLSLLYRPCKRELMQDYKVTALITCFNEDPASVVSILENVLALEHPVHEILFLDDGSADTLAYEVAKSFAEDHRNDPNVPNFQILRFAENRGKREVMIDGFQQATGDYIFLLDSDSEILPNALTELLRPFEDGKTTSVVGNIGILNKKENLLTRIQSISYFGAFQLGRAAQSVTGDVTICSGAFSIHKKDFILQHLDEFRENKFLGINVSSGDDRSLTSIARMAGGKTRYQSTAYCETQAPSKWRKFQKQRRRWQRSAYLCSLKSVKDMFPRKIWFLFWVFSEAYFWLIATVLFAVAVMTRGGLFLDWMDVILYFIIICYLQNIYYLLYNPIRFALAPIFFFVYGISLTITRVHAVVTIKNDGWGTRTAAKNARKEEKKRCSDFVKSKEKANVA